MSQSDVRWAPFQSKRRRLEEPTTNLEPKSEQKSSLRGLKSTNL